MSISITLHLWWYQYHSNHLPQLPINHLPLVSFTGLSEGFLDPSPCFRTNDSSSQPQKHNNCILFLCVTPVYTFFYLGSEHEHGHRLKYVFPPSGLNPGQCPMGSGRLMHTEGRERERGDSCATLKKRRVFNLGLSMGLLTWGNICCVEIETDDLYVVRGPASLYVDCDGREKGYTISVRPCVPCSMSWKPIKFNFSSFIRW